MIWTLMIGLFVGAFVACIVFVIAGRYAPVRSNTVRISSKEPQVETRFRQRTVGSDKPPARVTTARVRPISRRRGRY